MHPPALRIRQLVKTYRSGVTALHGIDLDVPDGDFFALLGPNGAGKSTTIGIVSSLVNKTAGRVEIFGHDLEAQAWAAKRLIGLVPQEFNFNQFEPVIEIVVTSIIAMFPTSLGGVPWDPSFEWKYVNYTPILVGGVLILLFIYWHASVKKWFTGPIKQVEVS